MSKKDLQQEMRQWPLGADATYVLVPLADSTEQRRHLVKAAKKRCLLDSPKPALDLLLAILAESARIRVSKPWGVSS
jgi:hypothetical protein